MAKDKSAAANPPNKPLNSRVSFLHQAAVFLASRAAVRTESPADATAPDKKHSTDVDQLLSQHLAADGVAVSLKAQIRLTSAMKRLTCQHCRSVLLDGLTSRSVVENASRGGRKPWADVLVRRCLCCGWEKRFPVGAQRPPKRRHRESKLEREDAG